MKHKTNIKKLSKCLPKYQLGKIAPGYQEAPSYIERGTVDTPNYNASGDAAEQKAMYVSNAVNQASQVLSSIKNAGAEALLPTWLKPKAIDMAASTFGKQAAEGLGKEAMSNIVGSAVKEAGTEVATDAAKTAATEGAKTGTKSALGSVAGAAGTALSVAGALYSGYNLVDSLSSYGDTIKSGDLMNYSTTINNRLANGASYKTIGGYDSKSVDDIVHGQNVNSAIKSIGSGTAMGASIGSIFPGLGTAIGAAAGALVGGIGHIFGASHRNEEAEKAKRRYREMVSGYNRQSESEGMSQMMRAYDGLPTGTELYRMAYNKNAKDIHGNKVGIQNAWANKGEVVYNPATKQYRTITEGAGGKDKAPIYTNEYESILGNTNIPGTNITYAEAAKRAADVGDTETLDALTASQNNKLNNMKVLASTRKNLPRRYDGQASDTLNFFIPAAINSAAALSQYNMFKNANIHKNNSYVPNQNAQAVMDIMNNRRYNVNPELAKINDVTREALYHYDKASLPAGLKYALQLQLYNDKMKRYSDAYANADKINQQYAGERANMSYQLGESAASRKQQADMVDADMYAKANAAQYAGMYGSIKDILANNNNLFKNIVEANQVARNTKLWSDEKDTSLDGWRNAAYTVKDFFKRKKTSK